MQVVVSGFATLKALKMIDDVQGLYDFLQASLVNNNNNKIVIFGYIKRNMNHGG